MAVVDVVGRKRKQRTDEDAVPATFSKAVDMEMLSDEEGDDNGAESNDEVDEFPEIDAASDSEDDDFEEDSLGDDEEDEDEDEEESSGSDLDDEHHVFPKPKTIVSTITGLPKRVYPEIEPDYDSDSSTEEASA